MKHKGTKIVTIEREWDDYETSSWQRRQVFSFPKK